MLCFTTLDYAALHSIVLYDGTMHYVALWKGIVLYDGTMHYVALWKGIMPVYLAVWYCIKLYVLHYSYKFDMQILHHHILLNNISSGFISHPIRFAKLSGPNEQTKSGFWIGHLLSHRVWVQSLQVVGYFTAFMSRSCGC